MGVGFTAPPLTEDQRREKRQKKDRDRLKARYGVCFPAGHVKTPENAYLFEGRTYCAACVDDGTITLNPSRWVYFVSDGIGHVKIGFANNPWYRLVELQCGNALPLTLLATIKGGCDLEKALHARFAEHHVRGEWFRLESEIRDYISSIPRPVEPSAAVSQPPPQEVSAWKLGKVPQYVRVQQELTRKQTV
jgi:hypothetical protein